MTRHLHKASHPASADNRPCPALTNRSRPWAFRHPCRPRCSSKEKIRPGDVLGALTKDIGLPGTQVGRIVVNDFSTYVAVARGVADKALRGLNAGKVKGRSVKVRRL
jgi:hypothetical protein